MNRERLITIYANPKMKIHVGPQRTIKWADYLVEERNRINAKGEKTFVKSNMLGEMALSR